MMNLRATAEFFKPRIPKRYLLFVAALMWTFAGGMLLFRAIGMFFSSGTPRAGMLGCIVAGLLFYYLLFSKISLKHITRIVRMPVEQPCIFSFFNLKSYLMMSLMITMGITLRKTGIVAPEYLAVLYGTMAIPLTMSAFRFYYYGFRYRLAVEKLS
ncbi:MAG: hypothetical protein QM800_05480 [Paludibacter sp.]